MELNIDPEWLKKKTEEPEGCVTAVNPEWMEEQFAEVRNRYIRVFDALMALTPFQRTLVFCWFCQTCGKQVGPGGIFCHDIVTGSRSLDDPS